MTIDQTNVVDFVSIEPQTGNVELTICDHLDWSENEEDHLMLLQDKLNSYLAFIESGELFEKFPETREHNIAIRIMAEHPLSDNAAKFFGMASATVSDAGFKLQFKHFCPDNHQNSIDFSGNAERTGKQ